MSYEQVRRDVAGQAFLDLLMVIIGAKPTDEQRVLLEELLNDYVGAEIEYRAAQAAQRY